MSARASVATAFTAFVALSSAMNVLVAGLYASAVTRLERTPALTDRAVRVLARPAHLTVGQQLTPSELIARLDRIGYLRSPAAEPGCYHAGPGTLTIWARHAELTNVTVRWRGETIAELLDADGAKLTEALVEPDTLAVFVRGASDPPARVLNTHLPYAALAGTPLLDAIVASEDRWFFTHHGVDVPRLVMAPFLGGGASTITAQVARTGVLHDRSRTVTRKLSELGLAMAIERKYSKEAILSAYVDTVDLGASRGRQLHGFAAAARELFDVGDVRALTLAQAATLAAALNRPSAYLSAMRDGDDSALRRQRNRVLRLMHRNAPDRYPDGVIDPLLAQPVVFVSTPSPTTVLENDSRYFLNVAMPALDGIAQGRAYATLDARLQRLAVEVVEQGVESLDRRLAPAPPVQAALLAVDPRSGEILAMVGGRSFDDSQFNRVVSARRQVGSLMKPFDYLAALERAAEAGQTGIGPNTIVVDEPTVFRFGGQIWAPENYDREYSGAVTWRLALAKSRNVAAVKVTAGAGFDRLAALWGRATNQAAPAPYPSLALGAIEATPAQVAEAYTAFVNGGVVRPLRTIVHFAAANGRDSDAVPRPRRIARATTAAQITDMMRAVFDEGTARPARAAGFSFDAAGKTGTTNDLRDAWFVGFTPELLTVVWVGHDDDRPLGLTGAQAALPIWTRFMMGALAGHADVRFVVR